MCSLPLCPMRWQLESCLLQNKAIYMYNVNLTSLLQHPGQARVTQESSSTSALGTPRGRAVPRPMILYTSLCTRVREALPGPSAPLTRHRAEGVRTTSTSMNGDQNLPSLPICTIRTRTLIDPYQLEYHVSSANHLSSFRYFRFIFSNFVLNYFSVCIIASFFNY